MADGTSRRVAAPKPLQCNKMCAQHTVSQTEEYALQCEQKGTGHSGATLKLLQYIGMRAKPVKTCSFTRIGHQQQHASVCQV
jgi:hypothetical protein